MSHDPTDLGRPRPGARPANHREIRDGATRSSPELRAFARAMEIRRREQAETALRPFGHRGYTYQEHEAAEALRADALALHRQADDEPDLDERADLQERACLMETRADALVPIEHARDR